MRNHPEQEKRTQDIDEKEKKLSLVDADDDFHFLDIQDLPEIPESSMLDEQMPSSLLQKI